MLISPDTLLNELADMLRFSTEREKYIKHSTELDRHIRSFTEYKDFKMIYCLPSIKYDKRVLIKLENGQIFALTIEEVK